MGGCTKVSRFLVGLALAVAEYGSAIVVEYLWKHMAYNFRMLSVQHRGGVQRGGGCSEEWVKKTFKLRQEHVSKHWRHPNAAPLVATPRGLFLV